MALAVFGKTWLDSVGAQFGGMISERNGARFGDVEDAKVSRLCASAIPVEGIVEEHFVVPPLELKETKTRKRKIKNFIFFLVFSKVVVCSYQHSF